MNTVMKRIFILVTVVLALASCTKEKSIDTLGGGNPPTGGGGGGGTTPDTYQPVTKGSFWKYKDSAFTGQITVMTATGNQKTIGGKTYHVVTSETTGQPASEAYFYVAKPLFGMRADVNNGVATTIEFIYLNDTASIGYTWTDNMPPVNGLPARFIGTMVEKNISRTVAGKNFTNVMHTQLHLEYDIPGLGWTNFAVYDYYVAKGVGIIRVETVSGIAGLRTVSDLIDYSIK
jgi:hypothetical protein